MTNKLLWSPDSRKTLLDKFIDKLNIKIKDKNYKILHKWSIDNKEDFWNNVWDFTGIIGLKKGKILKNNKNLINSVFFENCKLNYGL